jgi:lipopolysaccharide export system permease protein
MGLLLALLYTLTNHARYNEITAMRAAGISLGRICMPYLTMGVLAAMASFALNEFCVPDAADRAGDVLRRYAMKNNSEDKNKVFNWGFINKEHGRIWQISVYDLKTHEMIAPEVNWATTNAAIIRLSADRANWTNGMWVFSGKVRENLELRGQIRPLFVTNELAMPDFSERPKDIRSEININDALKIEAQRRTRRADVPLREILSYLHLHPKPDRTVAPWLYTKLHGRFAGPVVCIVVVLIAVPFAAGSSRRNVFVGVASSIFIFLIYFFLQQLGFAYGEKGQIAAWLAAWFPNLLFGAAGFWMMARVR